MRKISNILIAVRDFLFSTFNREFLIFLVFLVMSAAYWLMSVLNETMEREIVVPLTLTNIPRNTIILSDTTIDLHVVVRDKGYTMATYFYGNAISPLRVKFASAGSGSESFTVSNSELQKMLTSMLANTTKVVNVKPDRLEFKYNYGLHKRVPVRLAGKIKTAGAYYLARVQFSPEYVTVYTTARQLDSITCAYIVPQNIQNLDDTLRCTVPLARIPSAKMVPSVVRMSVFPDIITEAVVNVPVVPVNVPKGYTLRLFPSTVKVRYAVGVSGYKQINESQFSVVADYNSTDGGVTPKCDIRIVRAPKEARNPVLQVSQIDYIIEQ